MDAVFRIRFWETGDWPSIGHTRIYSSPSPELLQTLFSCWAALLVLDPKDGKEAEPLATSLCFLIMCWCGTEEFGMIWFFPWSTGRCHNCFGKKIKIKVRRPFSFPKLMRTQIQTPDVEIRTTSCATVREDAPRTSNPQTLRTGHKLLGICEFIGIV